jgi:SAM-dependent methyltransferase
VTDRAHDKTIDDVRRFWNGSPLFVGEGREAPGTREWFDEHERVYVRDCLAGKAPSIFTDDVALDARIVDVGCGPGFWVRYFARRGFTRVVACDLTMAAVELTTRSLHLFGLHAAVNVGNAEALPYVDGSADHVNCQGVLHHTPSPRRAVEEFARVLAPDGTLCISVYYRNWLLRRPWAVRLVAKLFGRFVGLAGRGRESILSSGDADEIVRMYDGQDNPIGRAYTGAEVRRLVSGLFEVERVERFYFPARALAVRVPPRLHRWLSRRLGLMIIVRARKRQVR